MSRAVIINGDKDVYQLFKDYDFEAVPLVPYMNTRHLLYDVIIKADLVVFCGGTDISCNLYNQTRGLYTDTPDTTRDILEQYIFKICFSEKIPMVGICRGAQLLNVLCGGTMIQHDGSNLHLYPHKIKYQYKHVSGVLEEAPSNHHQIMVAGKNAEKIAYHMGHAEILFYEAQRALCVQYHPEWYDDLGHAGDVFFDLIDLTLGVKPDE